MKDREDVEAGALDALIVLAYLGADVPPPPAAAAAPSAEDPERPAPGTWRPWPLPGFASNDDRNAAAA
jgi:hypothetical protein